MIISLNACNNKQIKLTYYEDSKQIKEKFEYFTLEDTSTYEYTAFYTNGQIKNKGIVRNSKREGNWQEWYEDGVFRGEFYYEDNTLYMFNEDRKLPEIILYADKLQPHMEVPAKVINLYPDERIFAAGGNLIRLDYNNCFDYLLIPFNADTVRFFYAHPFLNDRIDTISIKVSDMTDPWEYAMTEEQLIEFKNEYQEEDQEILITKEISKIIELLKVPIEK